MSTSTNTKDSKYSDVRLTEKDIEVFEARKKQYFKGSIAVAVVYGVLALFLVAIAVFTQQGRNLLTGDLKPFVITLVVGIFIVIIIMMIQLINAKPQHIESVSYDAHICPDYWNLKETSETNLNMMLPEKRFLASTYCERDTTKVPVTGLTDVSVGTISTDQKVKDTVALHLKDIGANNVSCSTLYPAAMGQRDEEAFPVDKNAMRCAVAKRCGFAWSSVCPN